MRPALAALAEQQQIIDRLVATARKQEIAINQLTRGLSAVAKLTGNDAKVRTAIFKRADEQNPAQPVPDPAGEAPTQTNAEAEAPEAKADVRAPGLVPGTNNDTAADAVSTAYTPGQDIPDSALHQLVDVTRPIDGTQGARPLSETKTLVDVRVGDPMKAQVAFPVNGPFANAQRTSSIDSADRAFAAQRLAQLRITAGTNEHEDEILEATSIQRDASLSDDSIQREIETYTRVTKAAVKRAGNEEAPRNLVPRSAAVRTVPQLTKSARNSSLEGDDDVESLFLGDL
jgi:hypothetical protein